MSTLQTAARWEFILLIVAFSVVTLWKLLQTSSFSGLIKSDDGTISPGRIQLLILTIFTAMQYLLTTIHDPTCLPQPPPNLVLAMGGSQAVYLATKAWNMFQSKGK